MATGNDTVAHLPDCSAELPLSQTVNVTNPTKALTLPTTTLMKTSSDNTYSQTTTVVKTVFSVTTNNTSTQSVWTETPESNKFVIASDAATSVPVSSTSVSKMTTSTLSSTAANVTNTRINCEISNQSSDFDSSSDIRVPSSTIAATVSASSQITDEETNFLRLSHLLLKVAPTAVRQMFDTYFPRSRLSAILDEMKEDLRHKRNLTKQQLSTLYPGQKSACSSTCFDMSLMIFLLNEKLKDQNRSSSATENSIVSKLMKIKQYRNFIAHHRNGILTNYDFSNWWREITEAVVDIGGPSYKEEIETLRVASLDSREREILMELRMLRQEVEELRQLRKPIYPSALNSKILEKWERENTTFVYTHATKDVFSAIRVSNCVIIRGSPGSGKSAMAHHIALQLKQDGFQVSSISSIDEIGKVIDLGEKTVFVMDDPLGTHILDMSELHKWHKQEENIKILCSDFGVKLFITSRCEVLNDFGLAKIPSFFNQKVIDLQSKQLDLTQSERKQIISKHLFVAGKEMQPIELEAAADIKIFCFPLMCRLFASEHETNIKLATFLKQPLDVLNKCMITLQENNKIMYLILLLCMVFDNKLSETIFWDYTSDEEVNNKIGLFLKILNIDESFSRASIKEHLESFGSVFLEREGEIYHFVHDMVFDALVMTLPVTLHESMLKSCSSKFIRERVVFSKQDTSSGCCIVTGKILAGTLCERLLADIRNKNFEDVFLNKSLKNDDFQRILVDILKTKKTADVIDIFCTSQSITKDAKDIVALREFEDMFSRADPALFSPDAKEIWRSFRFFTYLNRGQCTAFHWVLAKGLEILFQFLWLILDQCTKDCLNTKIPLLPLVSISGNINIFNILVKTDLSLDSPNTDGLQPPALYLSSSLGDVDMAIAVIERNSVNVNQCRYDSGGMSPLHIASQNGHVGVIRVLTSHGADINKPTDTGNTPFHFGVMQNQLQCIKVLTKLGAEINSSNNGGGTPLYLSARYGHTQCSLKLIYYGAEVNKPDNNGCSPLFTASFNGHTETMEALIECGADIHQCSKRGDSVLWAAAQNGHVKPLQLVIKKGANVNGLNDHGVSPLLIAAQEGHLNVVDVLLKAGADVNLTNKAGISPLIVTSQYGITEVIKLLLKHGSEINYCANGKNQGTALMYASGNGHIETVKTLLKHGSNINQQRSTGETAVFIASDRPNTELLDILLKNGADVNRWSYDGHSPLHTAAFYGKSENALKLIQHGADVNCDASGSSALWSAAKNGHTQTVKLLINYGADVCQRSEKGTSPVTIAYKNSHYETGDLIQKHLLRLIMQLPEIGPFTIPFKFAKHNNRI